MRPSSSVRDLLAYVLTVIPTPLTVCASQGAPSFFAQRAGGHAATGRRPRGRARYLPAFRLPGFAAHSLLFFDNVQLERTISGTFAFSHCQWPRRRAELFELVVRVHGRVTVSEVVPGVRSSHVLRAFCLPKARSYAGGWCSLTGFRKHVRGLARLPRPHGTNANGMHTGPWSRVALLTTCASVRFHALSARERVRRWCTPTHAIPGVRRPGEATAEMGSSRPRARAYFSRALPLSPMPDAPLGARPCDPGMAAKRRETGVAATRMMRDGDRPGGQGAGSLNSGARRGSARGLRTGWPRRAHRARPSLARPDAPGDKVRHRRGALGAARQKLPLRCACCGGFVRVQGSALARSRAARAL